MTPAPEVKSPAYPAKTIAALLMLTERRVQQLAKAGVIPKEAHGRYALAPSVQGYIRYLQERQVAGDPEGVAVDYHVEKTRKMKADADLAEIAARRATGEALDVVEVEAAWGAVISEIRAILLGQLPGRFAARAKGLKDEAKVKRAAKEEVVIALRALSASPLEALLAGLAEVPDADQRGAP